MTAVLKCVVTKIATHDYFLIHFPVIGEYPLQQFLWSLYISYTSLTLWYICVYRH